LVRNWVSHLKNMGRDCLRTGCSGSYFCLRVLWYQWTEELTVRVASWFVLTKYFSSDKIKEDEMGETFGAYKGDERVVQVYWVTDEIFGIYLINFVNYCSMISLPRQRTGSSGFSQQLYVAPHHELWRQDVRFFFWPITRKVMRAQSVHGSKFEPCKNI
jgi:hypothetical protein